MNLITELNNGEYTAEIVDIVKEKTDSGAPKVIWTLKIIGGDHDGDCVEKKGCRSAITANTVIFV